MWTQSEKEEVRKNSGEIPPFKQRFLRHISAGTRPGRESGALRVPWDVPSLDKALKEIMKGRAPSDRTTRKWLNEDDIPWFNDPAGIIQKEPDPQKRLMLAAVHHLEV